MLHPHRAPRKFQALTRVTEHLGPSRGGRLEHKDLLFLGAASRHEMPVETVTSRRWPLRLCAQGHPSERLPRASQGLRGTSGLHWDRPHVQGPKHRPTAAGVPVKRLLCVPVFSLNHPACHIQLPHLCSRPPSGKFHPKLHKCVPKCPSWLPGPSSSASSPAPKPCFSHPVPLLPWLPQSQKRDPHDFRPAAQPGGPWLCPCLLPGKQVTKSLLCCEGALSLALHLTVSACSHHFREKLP